MSLTKVSYSMIDMMPISVKDFGAVGDGVADDTAAVQAAFDFGVSTGKSFNLHFPMGIYKCNEVLLGHVTNQKGAIRIAITGEPKSSRILSIAGAGRPCFKVPKFWGYGAGSDWLFRDLEFKADTLGVGTALYFEALNWNTRIEHCNVDGFQNGLHILSSISLYMDFCRVVNCTSNGVLLGNATTGIPGLDEFTSNARHLNSFFAGCGTGLSTAGQQSVVRDNIFEGNTVRALFGTSDMSLVDGNWFEGLKDTIDGEHVGATFSNNIGIASSPSTPLFTNVGNSFNPGANNKCVLINTGEFNNRYPNFIFTQVMNNVQAVSQFRGINVTYASPGASGGGVLADSNGNFYTGSYVLDDPAYTQTAVQITETISGNVYRYDSFIVSFRSNPVDGIISRYMLPSNSDLTVNGVTPYILDSAYGSTQFLITRDGSGRLRFDWQNKNANTSQITVSVRPLADHNTQLNY